MPTERQIKLPEGSTLNKRRSLSGALAERRRLDRQHGKWGTQASMLYMTLAQSWMESQGARIAQQSGYEVEDTAAEIGYNIVEQQFRKVLNKLDRAGLSAKRVARFMTRQTEMIARKTNDEIGWTASFLDHNLGILGEEFHLKASYIKKLKLQALQKPLSLAS